MCFTVFMMSFILLVIMNRGFYALILVHWNIVDLILVLPDTSRDLCQPIRGQYLGHVIYVDQSEASIYQTMS